MLALLMHITLPSLQFTAQMESYEVTPHIHQYFTNTFINCVILLPR